jgi:predicted transcriptional regulator
MTTLTTLETLVIAAFNTNYNTAQDEKDDNASWGNVKGIAKATVMELNTVKGVLGSLVKKGLVFDYNEDGMFSLTDSGIDAHFEAIAEVKAEQVEDEEITDDYDQWSPLSDEEQEIKLADEVRAIQLRR